LKVFHGGRNVREIFGTTRINVRGIFLYGYFFTGEYGNVREYQWWVCPDPMHYYQHQVHVHVQVLVHVHVLVHVQVHVQVHVLVHVHVHVRVVVAVVIWAILFNT